MRTDRLDIPADGSGARYELAVHRFGPPGARPCVAIQAALHADEIPGMACAVALRQRLDQLDAAGAVRGEIVLIPVANPIGLAQRLLGADIGRFDLGTGGNFNRDFPALGPALIERIGERLTRDATTNLAIVRDALAGLIRDLPAQTATERLKTMLLSTASGADLVLDLHCDAEAAVHLYTHSRSTATFAPLAARLGAVAHLVADESGGDPFDEALSRPWVELAAAVPDRPVPMGCHSVTVELRGQADVTGAFAEADAAALIGFLQDLGVVAGEAPPLPPAACEPTALAACEPLVSQVSGILAYRRNVGERVRAGDVVADVTEPMTGRTVAVTSPCDGMFFARLAGRYARPGQRLGKVAGTTARRTGKLLSP